MSHHLQVPAEGRDFNMAPRQRGRRNIEVLPEWNFFGPLETSDTGTIMLKGEELEAIRLTDHEGNSQQDAAKMMGVSQPTLHRILRAARKKVGQALTEGKILRIHPASRTEENNTD